MYYVNLLIRDSECCLDRIVLTSISSFHIEISIESMCSYIIHNTCIYIDNLHYCHQGDSLHQTLHSHISVQ